MTTQYINIKDLAARFAVSVPTIRNWVRDGTIPASTYLKVKETFRFDPILVEQAFREAQNDPASPDETAPFDVSIYNQTEETNP